MSESSGKIQAHIDGITAKHAIITPQCRTKGNVVAFLEAVERLKEGYEDCLSYPANKNASFHLVLTVDR